MVRRAKVGRHGEGRSTLGQAIRDIPIRDEHGVGASKRWLLPKCAVEGNLAVRLVREWHRVREEQSQCIRSDGKMTESQRATSLEGWRYARLSRREEIGVRGIHKGIERVAEQFEMLPKERHNV